MTEDHMKEGIFFLEQLAPTSQGMTVNDFRKHMTSGSLTLRPPFQRNIVWKDEQRTLLIDSMLRGLPVPEIYIQRSTSAEGEDQIVVVDGQQRVSASLLFLTGQLRLISKDEELKPEWNNRTFKELDQGLKSRFLSYEFIVRKLPSHLDDDVLREVFRRLNKTVVPLLPQELRHAAYSSDLITIIERAGSRPVFGDIGVFSANDYLRRKNDELLAELALAVLAGAFPNKKEGLEELFLSYERSDSDNGSLVLLKRKFGRVIQQLDVMSAALRRTRFRNKSDFYSLFYALASDAERLPLGDDDSQALVDRLRQFSTLVNDIKREEAEGNSAEDLLGSTYGGAASSYLRAVERAASDRLNRVRRHEALLDAVGDLLAKGEVRAFSVADEGWTEPTAEELEAADEEEAEELAELREALRRFSDVRDSAPSPD